jgi:hypothetical protein
MLIIIFVIKYYVKMNKGVPWNSRDLKQGFGLYKTNSGRHCEDGVYFEPDNNHRLVSIGELKLFYAGIKHCFANPDTWSRNNPCVVESELKGSHYDVVVNQSHIYGNYTASLRAITGTSWDDACSHPILFGKISPYNECE